MTYLSLFSGIPLGESELNERVVCGDTVSTEDVAWERLDVNKVICS